MASERTHQLHCRIDEDTHNALAKRAREDHRTIQDTLMLILQHTLNTYSPGGVVATQPTKAPPTTTPMVLKTEPTVSPTPMVQLKPHVRPVVEHDEASFAHFQNRPLKWLLAEVGDRQTEEEMTSMNWSVERKRKWTELYDRAELEAGVSSTKEADPYEPLPDLTDAQRNDPDLPF